MPDDIPQLSLSLCLPLLIYVTTVYYAYTSDRDMTNTLTLIIF